MDENVLERVAAEAHGNPLALIELPHGLTPGKLYGGFALPVSVPMAGRIEASFRRRLANLPSESRRLLLVAAAEPTGDPALVWRAAAQIGVTGSAADAIHDEGLLDMSDRVTFRHPLVRSAIYGAADPAERRDVHRSLAAATDPELDPDRRAWHLAQAASHPDDEVATELERSAARAQARAGLTAAAVFLARSAEMTVEPPLRAQPGPRRRGGEAPGRGARRRADAGRDGGATAVGRRPASAAGRSSRPGFLRIRPRK